LKHKNEKECSSQCDENVFNLAGKITANLGELKNKDLSFYSDLFKLENKFLN